MGEAISVESDSLRPVGAKSYFDQIKYQNTIGVKDSQWTMKYKFEKGNFILNINTQNDLFQIHIIIHIFEGFLGLISLKSLDSLQLDVLNCIACKSLVDFFSIFIFKPEALVPEALRDRFLRGVWKEIAKKST